MRLTRRLRHRRADERGAIAVIVAVSMPLLLVITAMTLDFGLVRVDRQVDKSAADSAALAGLHALNLSGDGSTHPYVGICSAIRYLRANSDRFSGVTSSTGVWTYGTGAAMTNASGCTDTTLINRICVPGNTATWMKYDWTGSYQGTRLKVTIESGYQLSATSGWSEDALPAATAFQNDSAQGCDQLAVSITQNRKPGFGSIATSSDLISRIRTVGRVKDAPGGNAPAMLLLKQHGCPVLETGSNSGDSHIYVFGAVSSTGVTQPGTVHADSDGAGCTGASNQSIFLGKAGSGIVAFAAPQVANPSLPDTSKPGSVTSVAAALGASSGVISDGLANVFGSGALNEAGIAAGSKAPPSARGLVTRKPVDDRYIAGIRTVVNQAQSIWTMTAASAAATGWAVLSDCNPATLNAVQLAATKLFVDCNDPGGYKGTPVLPASTIVFTGKVNPSALLSMPNATKVYIGGTAGGDAISIGNGATLSIHTNTTAPTQVPLGNLTGTLCSNGQTTAGNKAVVVVKAGGVKHTGGLLQMCYATMVMLGNDTANGCVPATSGTAPTAIPCPSGTGFGQLAQTGSASVDWTAPNQYDGMSLPNGDPDPAKAPAWTSPDGLEDLAFWSESYGGSSNPTYSMSGSGTMHVVGVYMAPNATPFSVGGGTQQVLRDAQYIASSIALNGAGTQINMRVDPNAAVTLPTKGLVGLVR